MPPREPARPRQARLTPWLALILLVWAIPALAQEKTSRALTIGPGRLYTTEGREIVFSGFDLVGDHARYQTAGKLEPEVVPASTVLRVQKRTGHEGRRFAVGFGACVLAGSLIGEWVGPKAGRGLMAVLGAGSSTSDEHANVGREICLVTAGTMVGAGVGYWIGTRKVRYSTVYEDSSLKRR